MTYATRFWVFRASESCDPFISLFQFTSLPLDTRATAGIWTDWNGLEATGDISWHKQSFGICECANQHQDCHRCHPCFVKGLSTSKNTASASRRIRLVRSTGSSLSEPKKASASGEPCARLADTGLRIKAEPRGYKMLQGHTRATFPHLPSHATGKHRGLLTTFRLSGSVYEFEMKRTSGAQRCHSAARGAVIATSKQLRLRRKGAMWCTSRREHLLVLCRCLSVSALDGWMDARMIMIIWSYDHMIMIMILWRRTKRKVQESSAVITHYGWIAPARRLFDENTTGICLSWSSLSQTYLVIHIGMLPFSWASHLHSTKINATVVSHKENA